MKIQLAVIFVLLGVLSYQNTVADIIGYDYCGKPCGDPPGTVCAYSSIKRCHTYFVNKCEMKKYNCDRDGRYYEVPRMNCMVGNMC